ncbi:type II toxin-antitoxin system prevent-host-death family antitoxin [Saccharomonospora piscinae]|uniref:type II toxin-antitoxin system Phd/YefM family antitoxin n=1 Tax=Saccharomonospora piscinae TaxID=687388 RepID=UPI0009DEB59C
MSVGVRALRDGLSHYLSEVRQGHTVTVTDHGRPVARLVPVTEPTNLERLVAEGLVTQATRPKPSAPEPVQTAGTVSDLVSDQRQ